jgi:hypothetical protein
MQSASCRACALGKPLTGDVRRACLFPRLSFSLRRPEVGRRRRRAHLAPAALADARNREAVGSLVGRMLRPRAGLGPLAQTIAEIKAEARPASLTDADFGAELAGYNAERRDSGAGR